MFFISVGKGKNKIFNTQNFFQKFLIKKRPVRETHRTFVIHSYLLRVIRDYRLITGIVAVLPLSAVTFNM